MEIIDDLIYGIRTGEYWLISIGIMSYMLSVLYILIVQSESYNTYTEQVDAMNFAARLVLATIYLLICSVLLVIMSGPILKTTLLIVSVIVQLLMVKVDKLPIWMDE